MMSTAFPRPTIISPQSNKHELTVIILHGRGDDAPNFTYGFFDTLCTSAMTSPNPLKYLPQRFPTVKWVFPSARVRYSSVFQEAISEWFDIASLVDIEKESERQAEGLAQSVAYITSIVEAEAALVKQGCGVSKGRVILGGISMGCAVSVHVLLYLLTTSNESLGGFFGWCGWLPFKTKLTELVMASRADADKPQCITNGLCQFYSEELGLATIEGEPDAEPADLLRRLPFFLSHCRDDGVVSVELGRQLRVLVASLVMQVNWTDYENGGHWIKSPEAMDQFEQFLEEKICSPDGSKGG